MKVLLISANNTSINMPCFPLGPAYLAASLKKFGNELEIVDLMDIKEPSLLLSEKINAFNPALIAISIRNIDNQDPFRPEKYLPHIKNVVDTCRRYSSAPIVAGGPGYSIFPYPIYEYLGIDYGVIGEGEVVLCEMAKHMEQGLSVDGLPGVISSEEVNKSIVPARIDFTHSEMPGRELFDLTKYRQNTFMPIQGKRGCVMNCIYCTNPIIEGNAIRAREPKHIADEIEIAQNLGIDKFFFVDSIFNYPERHAIKLCKEIISRKLNIAWTCIINPFNMTSELAELLKKAGCIEVSLGFESGSHIILENLEKGFSTDDVRDTSKLLKDHGVRQRGFLLFGGPGENRKTFDESISFAESLELESMNITAGIRMYPNTKLQKIAICEGKARGKDNLLDTAFYISNQVKDWLYERVQDEVKNHQGWVI